MKVFIYINNTSTCLILVWIVQSIVERINVNINKFIILVG